MVNIQLQMEPMSAIQILLNGKEAKNKDKEEDTEPKHQETPSNQGKMWMKKCSKIIFK